MSEQTELKATIKQLKSEIELSNLIMDFLTKGTEVPQIAYANTPQGACQCFDDMTAKGMKLDLVQYRYYWP